MLSKTIENTKKYGYNIIVLVLADAIIFYILEDN